jgi:L-alanine-DL-glutamate epimerase-like enolase superfamily enzyme
MIHDPLLKNPIQLEEGYIKVPNKPGLGWELDENKISEYTVRNFPK